MTKLAIIMTALSFGIAFAQKVVEKPVEAERKAVIEKLKDAALLSSKEVERLIERGLTLSQVRDVSRMADQIAQIRTSMKEGVPGITSPTTGKNLNLAKAGAFDLHMQQATEGIIRMASKSPSEDINEVSTQLLNNYSEFSKVGDLSATIGLVDAISKGERQQADILAAKVAVQKGTATASQRELAKEDATISNSLYRAAYQIMEQRRREGKVQAKDFMSELSKLLECLRGRGLKKAA